MKKLTFFVMDNGKLPEGIKHTLGELFPKYAGKKIRLTIEEAGNTRTPPQNRFWFGVCIPVIRDWFYEQGYNFDATDVHEYMVRKVWKCTEVMFIEGEPYERRLSSTKLTTVEWEQRIDLSRAWCAEKGIILPFPNEADYD